MLKINIQDKLKEKGLNKNQFAKLMQIGYPAACALYDGTTTRISFDTLEIKGKTPLKGADVYSTDLRAGASLLVAGLIADGVTTIDNIELILRGYEDVVEKLQNIGAKIELIP